MTKAPNQFIIALINGLIGLLCVLFGNFDYALFRSVFVMSALVFVYLVVIKRDNVLFLTRTLFLGVIGYYPMFIKSVYGETSEFSIFSSETQGMDIVAISYVSTSMALLGNEIGLALGTYRSKGNTVSAEKVSRNTYRFLFRYSLLITSMAVFLISYEGGPSLLTAGYATTKIETSLGNTFAIANIGLLCLFLAQSKGNIRFSKPINIAVAVYYLGWVLFMHGLRQDVMSALLGIFVVQRIVHRQSPELSWKMLIFVLSLVSIMEIWGFLRNTLHQSGSSIFAVLDNIKLGFSGSDTDVHAFGTISPIATTFTNVIFMVDNNLLQPLYGYTFIEFIPRTPPEFLYPDRPRDYAWIFSDYGLQAAGGFFELAEAYLNFGLAGAFVVPCIISFLVARSYWLAFYDQTVFRYFLLFSFLAMWLRGTWYQIFAFYKTFLTAMIIYIGFIFFSKLMSSKKLSPTEPGTRFGPVSSVSVIDKRFVSPKQL